MRALLFLAVFALATQVHMYDVTEFYRTFVNTIPTLDVEAKNRIMNDGLDCIHMATDIIAHSLQNIHHEDVVGSLRQVIGSIEVFEHALLPKCAQTYAELESYFMEHRKSPELNTSTQRMIWQAKGIQLFARIVFDVLYKQVDMVAEDLAVFYSTGFGLMDAHLPEVLEMNYTNYVSKDKQQFIPEFFKGFFTGLGYTDLAQINATSQCVFDIIDTFNFASLNPATQRGDTITKTHVLLEVFMNVTDAMERCKKLNIVEFTMFKNVFQNFKNRPLQTIFITYANFILNLPNVLASENNMGVYVSEGQYELAGRAYANVVLTTYNGLMY